MKLLALDAMGVLYQAGDDIGELLVPFVTQHGGMQDANHIEELYRSTSLGQRTSADFWRAVGLDPSLEDEYLSGHDLVEGVKGFIKEATSVFSEIWCLSNDIAEWSVKLRKHFELEKLFDGFVISGDVGLRKPDPEIYQHLLKQTKSNPDHIIFVDDRSKNLDVAASIGFQTFLFGPQKIKPPGNHPHVTDYNKLSTLVLR